MTRSDNEPVDLDKEARAHSLLRWSTQHPSQSLTKSWQLSAFTARPKKNALTKHSMHSMQSKRSLPNL